jgi:hypothetical protein
VSDPFAIYANFETGAVDLSDDVTKVTVVGDVSYVETELGTSIRLGEGASRVTFDGAPELLNNSDYSLSVAFKKDQFSRDGSLFYFAGTAYMGTTDDEVKFAGLTTTGEWIKLSYSGSSLTDGDWHQVTMTYSETLGTAVLYLDGEEVDSQTGITGAQYTASGHDLQLGNLSQDPFGGLLDEVQFVRAALDADEVKNMYDSLLENPSTPSDDTQPVTTALIEQVAVETVQPDVAPLIVDASAPDDDNTIVFIEAELPDVFTEAEIPIVFTEAQVSEPNNSPLSFFDDVLSLVQGNILLDEKGWISAFYGNEETYEAASSESEEGFTQDQGVAGFLGADAFF